MTHPPLNIDRPPQWQTHALLEHVARYRLTVFAALQQLPVFSGCRPREIKNLLRYCRTQELIGVAPLDQHRRYWYLDSLGAEYCELPPDRTGPLSEPAKIRAVAMLRFCCVSDHSRHLFVADELAESFPMLAAVGLCRGYYFEPGPAGRIGFVRVDAGRRGRWDRVLQTIRQDIETHLLRRGFRQIVQAARFEITVVTILPQKAKRIQDSLPTIPGTDSIPVHVMAMPELLPLVEPGH